MTNKPKNIGTAAETAVVRYLQANGWATAERRALRGELDAGDVAGCPGICWEVKAGAAARTASDAQVVAWMAETETERLNAAANYGVLVVQRAGYGPARAGRWWAVLPVRDISTLLAGAGSTLRSPLPPTMPIRATLTDVVLLLRASGYGEPLGVAA